MGLIDTSIQPDPFDPQRGDVYESRGPFPQRIVVEDPPTAEDARIRYRVDGGVDSNLTSLGQFHLHLAGLGEIRGVGRVREHSPRTAEMSDRPVGEIRFDALRSEVGAVPLTSMRMPTAMVHFLDSLEIVFPDRGMASIAELLDMAFAIGICASRHPEFSGVPCPAQHPAAAEQRTDCGNCHSLSRSLHDVANRYAELADAVSPPGRTGLEAASVVAAATRARRLAEQIRSAITILGCEFDNKADAGDELLRAVRQEREAASKMSVELDSISAFIAPHGVVMPTGSTKPTSLELVRWLAVTGGVVPCACHPTLAEVQEAQDVDLMARWERYTKSKPTVDEPARPKVGEDHFPSVAEARALRLRTEVYRVVGQLREISEHNKWPIRERLQSAASVMLEIHHEKHAKETQILDFMWPRLERAAGLRLERDLINAATLCTYLPGGVNHQKAHNPVFCTGSITILAVKDRLLIQRQQWSSERPDFRAADVAFNDDEPRIQTCLHFGDRVGKWTWRGSFVSAFGDAYPVPWQGEWTEEKT